MARFRTAAPYAQILADRDAQIASLLALLKTYDGGGQPTVVDPNPALVSQIALLTTQLGSANTLLTDLQEKQDRPILGYNTTVWNWGGTLSTGGSTSDWQAGKFTTVQHDTSGTGPGLTVGVESGENVLTCTVSNTQQNVSGSNKRAEGVLSAYGSPGDIHEGDIIAQACEVWFPTTFFAAGTDSDWAVGPFQNHQDLPLGNGGPCTAMEIHQDVWRYRVMNGVFDKAVNSALWGTLYPGKTGDGGVLYHTTITSLGRGVWIPIQQRYRCSPSYSQGWAEIYINGVQLSDWSAPRFYIATQDFDGDPANPSNGTTATYLPVRNYAKFGLYQKADIALRYIKLRRLSVTKQSPIYSA